MSDTPFKLLQEPKLITLADVKPCDVIAMNYMGTFKPFLVFDSKPNNAGDKFLIGKGLACKDMHDKENVKRLCTTQHHDWRYDYGLPYSYTADIFLLAEGVNT